MNAINLKRFASIVLLVAFVAAISSCNRGLGCPTFSIDEQAVEIID